MPDTEIPLVEVVLTRDFSNLDRKQKKHFVSMKVGPSENGGERWQIKWQERKHGRTASRFSFKDSLAYCEEKLDELWRQRFTNARPIPYKQTVFYDGAAVGVSETRESRQDTPWWPTDEEMTGLHLEMEPDTPTPFSAEMPLAAQVEIRYRWFRKQYDREPANAGRQVATEDKHALIDASPKRLRVAKEEASRTLAEIAQEPLGPTAFINVKENKINEVPVELLGGVAKAKMLRLMLKGICVAERIPPENLDRQEIMKLAAMAKVIHDFEPDARADNGRRASDQGRAGLVNINILNGEATIPALTEKPANVIEQ